METNTKATMDYKCITTLQDVKDYLTSASVVAFDFETAPLAKYRDEPKASLDAHRSCIVGVSLSHTPNTAVYIPLGHRRGGNADKETIIPYLKDALFMNPSITKVAHNLAFESMFLCALGIIVQPPCYDTIAAAQLTLKNRYDFRSLSDSGLKKLAPELLDAELPSFKDVTQGKHFDELPSNGSETIRYACADSDYALQLYCLCNEWFDKALPKHRWIVENIESPTAVYCGMMKYNGVLMDKSLMAAKQQETATKIQRIKDDIHFIIGDVDLGENAATQAFKNYLYKELTLPVLKRTTKLNEAADDEAMVLLADWCKEHHPALVPFFELVQEYRKWAKLKSTYVDGYIDCINAATKRIHPDLMPLATQTGRFACRNPNLQNQVSPGSDPIGVRNFVIAPNGYVLLEADYSQVELRIAANLSGDETLITAYRNGQDIHAITTAAVFNIPLEEASDKHHPDYKHRRTVAKSTMFGILYGIYAKGLARNLKIDAGIDITEAQSKKYIEGIKARYSSLAGWQKHAIRDGKNNRYVETALGRRRYLPNICSQNFGRRSSAERMAINTPVQGLAADCLKLAMARLITELADKPYIRPIMTVHDSLVFEVRRDKAEEAIRLVTRCMEAVPPLDNFMPLATEVSVGERYGVLL